MEKKDVPLDEFIKELEEKERSLSIDGINSVELEIEVYEDDKTFLEDSLWFDRTLEIKDQKAEKKTFHFESQLQKEREELDRRIKDFEAVRKRFEKEKAEITSKLMIDVARRLLPVVDNLERAIESSQRNSYLTREFQGFLDGIIMVNQQLYEILAEMGVEPIKTVGMPFDPHFHEAIEVEKNSEFPNNTVVSEFLRGYRIGDKVIRHALVKVSVNENFNV
ncbi:MAG: nucleotide exchange factor GrpE [Pyrinomonadaceae bacterium]|nr:nucleotide exchange factor GrpE [Pyrinomonadaceae bacterium]MCX7639254.1 nucleotide exchange factor GrpE [Pyrinomonadaceae bacterium]MDW8303524.1 nucleotide exchange factor GrpE [Acidobacteriota bacterium]